MAKKANIELIEDVDTDEVVKVMLTNRGHGAYGLEVYDIPKNVLLKHATLSSKYEPDIFAIFINNMIHAARNIFGI